MADPPVKAEGRVLPKRFYRQASVDVVAAAGAPLHFRIVLDGRPVRTPAKAELALPTQALAEAVAAEWAAQGTHIDPATMPLTRIANSTLDGVVARRGDVEAEIVRYAMGDLIYYRADGPDALTHRQAEAWDPLLAWASQAFAAELKWGQGIAHVAQSRELAAGVARELSSKIPMQLAALHVITTLSGSALLALAHAAGAISAQAAWTAAHVDEDFQISQWGWDAEAQARRKAREVEFHAACRILATTASGQL